MDFQEILTNSTPRGELLSSLLSNFWNLGRYLLLKVVPFILRGLWTCFRWIGYWNCEVLAFLWRAFRVTDLLRIICLILAEILKWLFIVFAIIVGLRLIKRILLWGLPKLWEFSKECRRRKLKDMRLARQQRERDTQQAILEEARIQRAREEQALKDRQRKQEEDKRLQARAEYARWRKRYETAFQDKASMTIFPFPPLQRCTHSDCRLLLKLPVEACQHNVKQFFLGSGEDMLREIKDQRLRWHSDRFGSCPVAVRSEFQRLANSLFVVLDPWYEDLKREQAGTSRAGY